ncbi:preprotein translocase subunit Tim44 [Brevirhabdus pacifica]|uniref:Preprotein translocase subunit Tim44 n=1 Tax=Brevirhabdus pacifica TaxID=1267768 RepID=A0A1U7DIJ8_9RHOB|nr:Tim44/TimA family putative adaptor protein [Brevirhabdus pacifica]APX89820.1 preprotein translocase subunit Tim44 [Brevirhabdus pacifica]OWU74454.1 preprotein translocase subunit Tim44 [Loktanella sp. 22II-4b]PJJ82970.1 putative lipid-binding transport protein (Tim44 family) [Brevirhabdus pacifica]
MSSAFIQLLVLAGIAIFLILRLKNVLGTRDGFEKPPLTKAPAGSPTVQRDFEVIEGGPDNEIADYVPEESEAAKALAAMKLAEPGFSIREFLEGAKGAYEMILMGFERGDIKQIEPFLADEVRDSFVDVIGQREDQGLSIEANFVGLREVSLEDATYDRATGEGEITVRFVGELTSAVRDASGEIIEGNPNEIKRQRDVWTFGRVMGSEDPNWQLVATGG